MATLDPELDLLLVKKDFFEKNPSAGSLGFGLEEPLYIALKFDGDISALEQVGFKVGSVGKNIAYGVTNLSGLQALAHHPQVESIELQRRSHTHLNLSVPDIKADQVWGRSGDNFNGYTGRGVIVGIVDTGIDITHQCFRKADGTTRIVKIWDQTLTQKSGETVPGPITNPTIALQSTPLGYGVEYNAKQINDTLQGSSPAVPVRHVDEDGHGTHVSGIAAGDGSQSGGCHLSYHYIGVAPEADIIMVRMFGLTESDKKKTAPSSSSFMLDAIKYILDQANTLKPAGQAAVINLSLGKFTEKMDGTSQQCLDVDSLLTGNSTGRAIVFSAGNDGDSGFHASATVPAGPTANLALQFKTYSDDTKTRHLAIVYSGSNLQIQLTSPVAGPGGIISWVSTGNSPVNTTANGVGGTVTVKNAANLITIEIAPAPVTPATTPPTFKPNVAGTWKIELRDTGSSATQFDAFCLYGSSHDGKSPNFLTNVTSRSTLSEQATGHESIAVGSYKVGHGLSSYSSRGPTIDAQARTKPEICAPGEEITSTGISGDRHEAEDYVSCKICCCDCCQDFYVDKSGTSMSAPHITGVIALMLHKNPTLKHTQIKSTLISNFAPKPGDSTPDEDLGWGAGKVDAEETVHTIDQVNPPVARIIAVNSTAQHEALIAVRDQLLASERGMEFKGLFEKYFAEIRTLINTNRKVAAVWHRCNGPIWVRLSLRAASVPDMPVPMEAGGITLREAVRSFAGILKRYASASFRDDLQKYESEMTFVAEGMSLAEMIRVIGNKQPANDLRSELLNSF
jgi:subtilisin family serine protease